MNTSSDCCTPSAESATCCTPARSSEQLRTVSPHVGLVESPENFRLQVNLPGVVEDSVNLSVENSVLTITAEAGEPEYPNLRPLHREFGARKFERRFALGDSIDLSAIDATLNDGVLEVTLPRSQKAMPQRIEVRRAKHNQAITE